MAKLVTWGYSHLGVFQLQTSSRLPGWHSRLDCSHNDGENKTWILSLFFLHISSHMYMCPLHAIFFEASHWPSDPMIFLVILRNKKGSPFSPSYGFNYVHKINCLFSYIPHQKRVTYYNFLHFFLHLMHRKHCLLSYIHHQNRVTYISSETINVYVPHQSKDSYSFLIFFYLSALAKSTLYLYSVPK